jgi:uncharacterized MAPEG superfamily protein
MQLALLSLLLCALLPLVCAATAKWGFKGYDNHRPREWLAMQSGFRARANAAQANTWEGLTLFGPAVAVAVARGASETLLGGFALAFLLLRVAYIACYLSDRATLRSIIWFAGYLITLAIYGLALAA